MSFGCSGTDYCVCISRQGWPLTYLAARPCLAHLQDYVSGRTAVGLGGVPGLVPAHCCVGKSSVIIG